MILFTYAPSPTLKYWNHSKSCNKQIKALWALGCESHKISQEISVPKMIIFYLFLTVFSNAEGFPFKPEENGFFSRVMQDYLAKSSESCKILAGLMKEQKTVVKKVEQNENLSPVINCEHEDSVEIQEELTIAGRKRKFKEAVP